MDAGLWLVDPLIFEGPYDPSDPAVTEMPAHLLSSPLPILSGAAAGDVLVGGDGDDTYVSFSVTMRVVEAAGEGIDMLVVLSD